VLLLLQSAYHVFKSADIFYHHDHHDHHHFVGFLSSCLRLPTFNRAVLQRICFHLIRLSSVRTSKPTETICCIHSSGSLSANFFFFSHSRHRYAYKVNGAMGKYFLISFSVKEISGHLQNLKVHCYIHNNSLVSV
jgi:hypothetical protein